MTRPGPRPGEDESAGKSCQKCAIGGLGAKALYPPCSASRTASKIR